MRAITSPRNDYYDPRNRYYDHPGTVITITSESPSQCPGFHIRCPTAPGGVAKSYSIRPKPLRFELRRPSMNKPDYRLKDTTPKPLFSPQQNCRPETIRSISTVAAHSTRLETPARFSTRPLAPPNPATAASRSRVTETPRAYPAGVLRCAASTKMPSSTWRYARCRDEVSLGQ